MADDDGCHRLLRAVIEKTREGKMAWKLGQRAAAGMMGLVSLFLYRADVTLPSGHEVRCVLGVEVSMIPPGGGVFGAALVGAALGDKGALARSAAGVGGIGRGREATSIWLRAYSVDPPGEVVVEGSEYRAELNELSELVLGRCASGIDAEDMAQQLEKV